MTRTKAAIKSEMRREREIQKRLVERRDLASANLDLSQERMRQLEKDLATAPEAQKFFY